MRLIWSFSKTWEAFEKTASLMKSTHTPYTQYNTNTAHQCVKVIVTVFLRENPKSLLIGIQLTENLCAVPSNLKKSSIRHIDILLAVVQHNLIFLIRKYMKNAEFYLKKNLKSAILVNIKRIRILQYAISKAMHFSK